MNLTYKNDIYITNFKPSIIIFNTKTPTEITAKFPSEAYYA